ncbi:MAG: hypothetical protein PWP37_1437 [Thermotogota bacterium]|nr:hypothetical protein [Thermotogota bacterium]MDK2865245.1 hypothetical protein [Thermotogota bacterium]HCZ05528.1 hypothetical protein [Thermotogota bacterium]
MKGFLVCVVVIFGSLLLAADMAGGGFMAGYFQVSLDAVNETFGTNLETPSFAFGGSSFTKWKGKVLFLDVISGGEGYGVYTADNTARFSGGLGYAYIGLLLKIGNLGFDALAGIGGAGFTFLKDVTGEDTLSATDISENGNVTHIQLNGLPAVFGADVTFDITDNLQFFVGARYNLWLWKQEWTSPFDQKVAGFDFDPLMPQVYVTGIRFGRF